MNLNVVLMLAPVGAAVIAAVRRRNGVAFADAAGGGRSLVVDGQVLGRYLDEGGPLGGLGKPVAARRPVSPGPDTPIGADQEAVFEHGTIYLDSAAGRTKVMLSDD